MRTRNSPNACTVCAYLLRVQGHEIWSGLLKWLVIASISITLSAQSHATQQPGVEQTVVAFERAHVWFGKENRRELVIAVDFPEQGAFAKIRLDLELSCPQGGCDAWDRFGSLAIVPEDQPQQRIELARFITPYGVGGAWSIDLTDLRPLLKGKVHIAAFIDTWVGPDSGRYGAGWLLGARFHFSPGKPPRQVAAVIPVFPRTSVVYGNPGQPIASQLPARQLQLPSRSPHWVIRSFVTGHGQGNRDNCAEFCAKTHHLQLQDQMFSKRIWRDDCDQNPLNTQKGNWKYPRAGWCPGSPVSPWLVDVSRAVSGTGKGTSTGPSEISVAYAVEAYDNSCRPDAPICSACTLGTGCAYDDGRHTEPRWIVSSLLIAYH